MRDIYTPNHVPAGTRIWHIILSVGLIGCGSIGVYIDGIYLPGKRTPGPHFYGEPAWLSAAAMCFAALSLISFVADHYDCRDDNEADYRMLAKFTHYPGGSCFIPALIPDWLVFHEGARNG